MKLIHIYCLLYLPLVLLLQPVWAASKYIVPILPFILIFLARGVITKTSEVAELRNKTLLRLKVPLAIIPLALMLSNAIYITHTAIKQVGHNISYCKGDKYAGYPAHIRQMFEDMERAKDLPADVRIVCRKPEILYVVSGRQSVYPWEVKENR